MRVLILSQYYKPEPIYKAAEFAVALQALGHEVWVVTGLPNYPSGKLSPGYRLGLVQRELLDGVRVVRTFEFPYHGKSVVGRVLNYASVMLSTPVGSFFVPRCDVAYVWHPPLSIGVSAWMIRLLRGVPFVYDVQDIWPESALASGLLRKGLLVSGLAALEKFVYRRARRLLVLTEDGRQNLISKGVPPSRVTVMPQWVDDDLFARASGSDRDAVRRTLGWDGHFVVLFAGNLGIVQGLETVLEAARHLTARPAVRIALMGDGSDRTRLISLAATMDPGGIVQFIDHQPVERMPDYMAAADVLLVHLKESRLCKFVIPSKTFAYLAAGKPILMAVGGAAAELIEKANAGITVPPEAPGQLATAIRSLQAMSPERLAAYGISGRDFLLEHQAMAKVIPKYVEVLEEVAAERR